MSGTFTRAWLERHRVDARASGPVEIVGIGHVTRELHAIAARLTEPDRARAMGLEPPRGRPHLGRARAWARRWLRGTSPASSGMTSRSSRSQRTS